MTPGMRSRNCSDWTSLNGLPNSFSSGTHSASSLKRSAGSFTSNLAALSLRSSTNLSRSSSTSAGLMGLNRKRSSASLGSGMLHEQRKKGSKTEISALASGSSAPGRVETTSKANATFQAIEQPVEQQTPHDYLLAMLQRHKIQIKMRPSLSMPKGYFVRPTNQSTENYAVLSTAVRARDLEYLRTFLKEQQGGNTLYCSNKFGESILHMACRRGFTDVVEFLLTEGKTSVRIVDDYGRTPLHDACWTSTPNPDVMNLLIREAPELLLVSDRRGHAPLQYTQRADHPTWIAYLQQHEYDIVDYIRNAEQHSNIEMLETDPAKDGVDELEVVQLLRKMANTGPSEVALFSDFTLG